jgi:hypothetical protein
MLKLISKLLKRTDKSGPTIPCVCLTCGVRDNYTSKNGYCQNGHDNWLHEDDVAARDEHFERAVKITGFTPDELERKFNNPYIKKFPIKNKA